MALATLLSEPTWLREMVAAPESKVRPPTSTRRTVSRIRAERLTSSMVVDAAHLLDRRLAEEQLDVFLV